MDEDFLKKKLELRIAKDALRTLRIAGEAEDYFSNDYLGIARGGQIEKTLPAKSFAILASRVQL